MPYGLIAGNGRFPILALETARQMGVAVVAIGIKEEAAPEIEALATRTYWISLGALGKLIDICKSEGITELMMAGQVKHASIFSSIAPDWRLAKLLFSLKEKNTEALIGGVAEVLAGEGIRLVDSTLLLKPLLAGEGVLTRRKPNADEEKEVRYGRRIAAALAGFDVGQAVAISNRACVALEAMEGTDAMLRRAAGLANGHPLRLIKSSRRRQHMLFDVPVAGLATIATMRETNTTILACDAHRTLLLDKDEMIAQANAAGICISRLPRQMSKLRIAVVGAGAFGRNHMRVIRSLPEAELTAVCDTDPARAAAAAAEFGCRALPLAALAGAIDAAVVAVPTFAHAEVGCALLAAGIDVLVEKPIAPTLEAADALIQTAAAHGRILQVGHLERFNPAVTALAERITVPLFLKSTG
jgi:DUF1009 family protein